MKRALAVVAVLSPFTLGGTCGGGGSSSAPAPARPLLEAVTEYATASWPEDVAAGDFDRDGHADIAVGHFEARKIVILRGGGGGTFSASASYALGSGIGTVEVADLDGDGALDLLAGTYGGTFVLSGAGDGTFTVGAAFGGALLGAPADVDGDGWLDVLTAQSATAVQLWQGRGDGTFTAGAVLAVADGPDSAAIADVDGDGDLDLVVASISSDTVSVLRSNGDGTWAPAEAYGAGQVPRSVTVADLDGDGDVDIALASWFRLAVLLGNGDGTFAPNVQYGGSLNGVYALAAGDFDGDGDVDLAATETQADRVRLFVNRGDGTFGGNLAAFGSGTRPRGITAADLDGDGDLDLAAANLVPGTASVFLGLGDGSFEQARRHFPGYSAYEAALGDLDGDGDLDAVVTHYFSAAMSVALRRPDGSFQYGTVHDVGEHPSHVALADLDGDGHLDAVVLDTASDDLAVLRGDGNGSFGPAAFFPTTGTPYALALGDLDGDGHLDAIVGDLFSSLVVHLGQGDGTFGSPTTVAVTATPRAVALGDVDRDGHLDAVVTNAGPGIFLLRGRGDGSFQAPVQNPCSGSFSIALADLDGDGWLDVAASDFGSSDVWVCRGNGSGGFLNGTPFSAGAWTGDLAVGDLDLDGRPDVVATLMILPPTAHPDFPAAYRLAVLRGRGDGTLASPELFGVGRDPRAPVLGDVDRDGDLDVALVSYEENALWVYRNTTAVADTTPPVVTPPPDVVVEATGPLTPVDLGTATALDEVSGPLVATPSTSGPFPIGTTVVTWTATDAAGNVGSATQFVTVRDTTPPAVTPPPDATVEATGPLTPVALGSATAVDLVSGALVASPAPSGPFPVGATLVTWTAMDAAGNVGSATQLVTVRDTTGPAVAPPPDIVTVATGALTQVDLGVATATDLVDGVLTATPSTTGPFPPGTTVVTWTAADSRGNVGSATQRVALLFEFAGFLPPVGNPPEVNARKAGSAVPMKWSIGDGHGGHLRDLSMVSRLEYAEIPCDTATPEIVDALPADDAGGSGLRYDASCEQFVFVWKTPRHPESCCVVFVLTLSDGTQHLARFVLR